MKLSCIKETTGYLFNKKNWGRFIGALFFFYFLLILIWLKSYPDYKNFLLSNGYYSLNLKLFLLVFFLLTFVLLISPLWTKTEQVLCRQTTVLSYLAILLFGLFIVPYFSFWPALNTPWWNFNWIYNYWWLFQILGIGISFSVLAYYWIFEPLLDTKLGRYLDSPLFGKKAIWLIFIVGFVLYSILQINIYATLGSPLRDIGIFDQAIWNLSQFHLPASTVRHVSNLWGDHFNPIIAFIVPLYWLKSDVRWLFFVQAFVVSLGVFPIYAIAKQKLKSEFFGIALAISWLFFLGLQNAIRFGFYPETLGITFFAFAFYFFLKNKIWPYFLFIFLALLTKENYSLYVVFLGLWLILAERRFALGLGTGIIGLIWFKGAMLVIPALGPLPYDYFRYSQLGANPYQVFKTLVLNPLYSLRILFEPEIKILAWLYYFIPFGFLPLLSAFAIVLIPVFAEKYLSSERLFWSFDFHYAASAITFLAVGTVFGIENLLKTKLLKKIQTTDNKKIIFFGIFLITMSVMFFTLSSEPAPLLRLANKNILTFNFTSDYQAIIKQIPPDKSLSAQMTLGTALAHRQEIYLWPETSDADYILVSSEYTTFPLSIEEHRNKIKSLINDSNYGIKYSQGKFLLLEKDWQSSVSLSLEMRNFLNEQ